MSSKIYTKTGDKGTTGLIGGTRVPKDSIRIDAYGTVDELNSYLGLLRDIINDKQVVELIIQIQDRLFTIGSHLAADREKNKMPLPMLFDDDIVVLEKAIDEMESHLEPMKHFVLPGGHSTISYCHIARCVCRRAERAVVKLSHETETEKQIVPYLNRLSDYLFVLSRYMTKKLNAQEIAWHPKLSK